MGMYRIEWDCCGNVSETDSYEPDECPFCEPNLKKTIEAMRIETLEKAAKVCEGIYPTWDGSCIEERYAIHAVKECAAAIRGLK